MFNTDFNGKDPWELEPEKIGPYTGGTCHYFVHFNDRFNNEHVVFITCKENASDEEIQEYISIHYAPHKVTMTSFSKCTCPWCSGKIKQDYENGISSYNDTKISNPAFEKKGFRSFRKLQPIYNAEQQSIIPSAPPQTEVDAQVAQHSQNAKSLSDWFKKSLGK